MDCEIKTMDLSFCGEVAHNVVNKDAKEYILNQLKSKYNIGINDNRAYILNEKSVYFLEKTQHIISIKSSGTNYLLFLTRINNTNYCFYIDRKISPGYTVPRIISSKYGFSDEVFNDTLLDGELVKNSDNQWMFLITDMLVYNGKRLETNIISRFNLLYKVLSEQYTIDRDFDICPLVVKKLFKYSEYDYLITQFIPSLTYKTKGLYFNTLNTKHANQLFIFPDDKRNSRNKTSHKNMKAAIQQATDNSRESNHANSNTSAIETKNQVLLRLQTTPTPEIYNLYYKDQHDIKKLDRPAYIHGLKNSRMVKKYLAGASSVYVYCKYNLSQQMWEPVTKAEVSDDSYLSSIDKINKLSVSS